MICHDSAATLRPSPVSRYNRINASKDVTGNEAITAANKRLRLAISEIKTIRMAETELHNENNPDTLGEGGHQHLIDAVAVHIDDFHA